MLQGVVGPLGKGEGYLRMIVANAVVSSDDGGRILDMSRLDAKTLSLHEVTLPWRAWRKGLIEGLTCRRRGMKHQRLCLQTEDQGPVRPL